MFAFENMGVKTTYPLLAFLGKAKQFDRVFHVAMSDLPKELSVASPQITR